MINSQLRGVIRGVVFAWAALVLALTPDTVGAQVVLPGFPDTNGPVNTLAVAGNTLFVGGSFSLLGQYCGAGVVVDAANGTALDDSPVLRSTDFGPGGIIFAVASDGANGWFVGGIFSSVDGQPRQNLAHIVADRSVSGWNPGADAPVRALLVSGATLYVGGDFSVVGGVARTRLVALNTLTAAVEAWNPGANGVVEAFALSGTTLYVGGAFTQLAGQARARIGAVDIGTGAATAWAPILVGNSVEAIALDANVAFVGGGFSSVSGLARQNAAAIDLTTAVANAWSPDPNGVVHALAITASDVYAGGDFGTIGGRGRIGIARLNKTSGAAAASWNATCDGSIWDIQVLGTSLLVGGSFSIIGGQSRANASSLVLASGIAAAWAPALDGSVRCLQASGTQAFIGGYFRYADVISRNNLAAVDMTTLAVTDWNPNPSGLVGGEVLALTTNGATLYVAGRFGLINAQTREALAAFDVASGALLPFDARINEGLATIPFVQALSLDGGALRLGGSFGKLGLSTRNYAGAVDPLTAAPLAWAPEPNAVVHAFASAPSGVFLAGAFTTVSALARPFLAHVEPTTGSPTAWPSPAFVGGYRANGLYQSPAVHALDERDGELFVGGSFSNVGGLSRMNAVSLDVATATVRPWTPPGTYIADPAYGVYAFETSLPPVFAGTIHPLVNGLLKLDPTTGASDPWPPAVMGVRALARSGPYLLLGGHFSTVGGEAATYLAALSDPSVLEVQGGARESTRISLSAPSPNPTRSSGFVVLSLPAPERVSVHVLDLAGRRVHAAMEDFWLGAGRHTIEFQLPGRAPGLYLVEATAGRSRAVQKLVVSR